MDWLLDRQLVDQAAQRLAPSFPETTAKKEVARAVVALSAVCAAKRGHSTRISRAQTYYARPARYKDDSKHESHYLVVPGVDALVAEGFLDQELGYHCVGGPGRQTTIRPTQKLNDLLIDLVPADAERPWHDVKELLVLRDKNARPIDYTETTTTRRWRRQVERLNAGYADLDIIDVNGKPYKVPPMRRIFNLDFTRGGRLYHAGASYQNSKKEWRQLLQVKVGDTYEPVVEIDFKAIHVVLAYREVRRECPLTDPYEVPGFPRQHGKILLNTAFNAKHEVAAVRAFVKKLKEDPQLRELNPELTNSGAQLNPYAKKLLAALKHKHKPIRSLLCSDAGARFQKIDSDAAVAIALEIQTQTGITPLVEHDSFIVPVSMAGRLARVMKDKSRRHRDSEEGFRALLVETIRDPETRKELQRPIPEPGKKGERGGTRTETNGVERSTTATDLGKWENHKFPETPEERALRASENPTPATESPPPTREGPEIVSSLDAKGELMRWVYLTGLFTIVGVFISDVWFGIDYRLGANLSLIFEAVFVTAFTVLYGLRSRPWTNRIGRVFFVKSVALALVLWQIVLASWWDTEFPLRQQIRYIIYTLGAVVYIPMLISLWREQQRDRRQSETEDQDPSEHE
ncbi:putative phage holin [Mycobacteroides sp. PCS013]|uniref:putative phage holin n=1 Tax=Mycobacteroides sp. PCS013 TaxID=3074106 RepID=UPI003C2C2C54